MVRIDYRWAETREKIGNKLPIWFLAIASINDGDSISSIGKRLFATQSNIRERISELEEMGLVVVKKEKGRRAVKIMLTEKGKQMKIYANAIVGMLSERGGVKDDNAI